MSGMIYKLLTTAIIFLGQLRDRFGGSMPKRPDDQYRQFPIRFDRTLPWPNDDAERYLNMGCCDCGLTHVIVWGMSVTPKRPLEYNYGMRLGAVGYTKPDVKLGEEVRAMLVSTGDLIGIDENSGKWEKLGE